MEHDHAPKYIIEVESLRLEAPGLETMQDDYRHHDADCIFGTDDEAEADRAFAAAIASLEHRFWLMVIWPDDEQPSLIGPYPTEEKALEQIDPQACSSEMFVLFQILGELYVKPVECDGERS